MTELENDLASQAEMALSKAEEMKAQIAKLRSLKQAGEVTEAAAQHIEEEAKANLDAILELSRDLSARIEERLKAVGQERQKREKQKEIVKTKHLIGAMTDEEYEKETSKIETSLQQVLGTEEKLRGLPERLQRVQELREQIFAAEEMVPEGPPEEKVPPQGKEAAKSKAKTEGPMICGKCGAENRAKAKFCKICGGRLEKAPEPETKTEKAALRKPKGRRVLFLGIHGGRIIGDKITGFDEVFAFLTNLGIEVKYEIAGGKSFQSSLTPGYLRDFGVVLILGSHNDRFDMGKFFDDAQLETLKDYVASGGSLLVTPSIYGSSFNYLEIKDGLSKLCKTFGVSFPIDHGDLIASENKVESKEAHYPGKKPDWVLLEGKDHVLTRDVGKIAFGPHGGAYLKVEDEPKDPKLTSVEVIMKTGKQHTPPDVPVMTMARYGHGKAIILGSPTTFMYPEFFSSELVGNTRLLENAVKCLLDELAC